MTMTSTMPKRISDAWMRQQEMYLRSTVKEIDGQPNPAYMALQQEIADAKKQQAEWDAFAGWVAKEFNLKTLNQYPLRGAGGCVHESRTVFCRKDANGIVFRSVAECWELFTRRDA
jgi:hypothetical protein